MTKHCNNCSSQQQSWAEHPTYQSSETFACDERCWRCNRWTLSREMIENAPSISLNTFFNPFAPLLLANNALRFFSGKDLENHIQTRTSISAPILDVVPFETWWNKNVGTIINGNYSYTLWLVIHEPSRSAKKFEISRGYDKYNLSSVKNRISSLRNQLNSENPILYVYPDAEYCSYFFNMIVKSPYVIKIEVPYEWETRIEMVCYPTHVSHDDYDDSTCNDYRQPVEVSEKVPNKNPSNYLKTLDIAKVKRSTLGNIFYHFGIYIGNNQVCHYSDPNSKKNTDNNRARITSWETFVRGCIDGEVIGYHTVIPFKNYREIARSIAWDEANNYGNWRYCLANNNCEHYVNSRVFGLNWSEQVAERPSKARENAHRQGLFNYAPKCYECSQGRVNNGKSGSFNLRDRLNQNLSQTDNWRSQEISRKYEVEVPPKENCRVM